MQVVRVTLPYAITQNSDSTISMCFLFSRWRDFSVWVVRTSTITRFPLKLTKVPKIDVAKEDAKWNAYKTVENRLRETRFIFVCFVLFALFCLFVCLFVCFSVCVLWVCLFPTIGSFEAWTWTITNKNFLCVDRRFDKKCAGQIGIPSLKTTCFISSWKDAPKAK